MRGVLFSCVVLVLLGCSGTPRGVKNPPSSTDSAVEEALIQALTTEPELTQPPGAENDARRGILGLFRRKNDPVGPPEVSVLDGNADASALPIETAQLVETQAAAGAEVEPVEASNTEIAVANAPAEPVLDAPDKPRLFGILRKRTPDKGPVHSPGTAEAETVATAIESDVGNTSVLTVEASLNTAPTEATPERRPRGPKWLRRGRRAPPQSLEQPDFDRPLGTLPFGELVPNCDVKQRDLGKLVDKAQGGAKFKLYDPDPTSTTPHTQYLTGFSDGCARQFTGSLALFGSPVVHEATRYNPNNSNPYSQTDTAYEQIKKSICGVSKGKHCPHPAINKLGRAAAFVTIYQGFGSEGAWVEVLLLNGEMVAYQTRNQ